MGYFSEIVNKDCESVEKVSQKLNFFKIVEN